MYLFRYWEDPKGFSTPPVIDKLMYQPAKYFDGEIIHVHPGNLLDWLPNIYDRVLSIKNLAHKADCIRARLLQKYGGVWIDPDAILVKPINDLFKQKENLVGFREADNKPVKIGFLYAPANHPAVNKWVEAQNRLLHHKKFSWTELGAIPLTAGCETCWDKCTILSDRLIEPIHWQQPQIFQEDISVEKIVTSDLYAVMLYFSRGANYYALKDNTLIKRLVDRF